MIRLAYFSLVLLAIPVFLGATDRSISLLHFFGQDFVEDGFTVNINLVIPLFGAGVLLFARRLPKVLVGYFSFFVVWLALSLIAGLREEPSKYNVIFYVQTVLPLLALFAGYALVPNSNQLDAVLRLVCLSMAGFIGFLWFVVFSEFNLGMFLHERNTVMQYIAAGIPQFRNYFPASTLIVFNIALAKYIFDDRKNQEVYAIALVALFHFFPLCWSRTALLGFSLSLFIQICLALRYGSARSWNKTLIFSVVAAFALPIVLAKFGTTVGQRAADIVDSDLRRLDLFQEGLQQSFQSPLFGDKFVPKWEVLAGGQEVLIKRLFPAHNQYIDYLLRAGYPFLIVFLAMMVDIWRQSLFGIRLGRAQGSSETVAICAAVFSIYVAFAIGANFQLYFVQLQSAVPCFFFTGCMFRTVERARVRGLSKRHAVEPPSPHRVTRRRSIARPVRPYDRRSALRRNPSR